MDKKDRLHSCNLCNKYYSSYKSLWNHNNKFHKLNNNNNHNSTGIVLDLDINSTGNVLDDKYNCQFCKKCLNLGKINGIMRKYVNIKKKRF